MRNLIVLVISTILFLAPLNTAFAGQKCTTVYGGGQNCVTTGNIGISKSVMNPSTGGFVANLSVNDPKYNSGQTVNFQVTVTNNDSEANTITVTDTLPQFFHFVSGPGTFNSGNNTLTWTVTGLGVGQSQTFTVSGTVTGNIPTTGDVCTVNQVAATSNNGDNANASSQYCITNAPTPTPVAPSVVPPTKITTTPPTGSESLALLALMPGALAGLGFIRLSKKS
jgi:fimbrial isopeptide formation D2 family protein